MKRLAIFIILIAVIFACHNTGIDDNSTIIKYVVEDTSRVFKEISFMDNRSRKLIQYTDSSYWDQEFETIPELDTRLTVINKDPKLVPIELYIYVDNKLVKYGKASDRVFTISYIR